MDCQEYQRLIVFYACDEASEEERAALGEHLKGCAACAAALERERRLLEVVAAAEPLEPSAVLVSRCRAALDESLDALPARRGLWPRLVATFVPVSWFAQHPAWSAALFLVVGLGLGQAVPGWLEQPAPPRAATPTMTVAEPGISAQDLPNLAVNGINWVPGSDEENPNVELHLTAERPLVVTGSTDNAEVRQVLTLVVRSGQRFDSGLRLDSVELLKARTDDTDVRDALIHAARTDRNPGVRLKALEALRGLSDDLEVRQAMFDALVHDDNPGVRVEAINFLSATVESTGAGTAKADPRLVQVLKDRMERDPSTYVRLQCASAMRKLGPRATY